METKDIERIEELINEIKKIHGNCLTIKKYEGEAVIIPTNKTTFYSTYIDNIIKYVEATKNNWYITVNEQVLYLHCF